jgi:hypothetical protein
MARPPSERIFGGTPWPPGRMRLELRQLLDDLKAWGSYRHDDVADGFRLRGNRVLLHLRSQPDGRQLHLPPDFEFRPDEYTPGAFTITAAGAARLEAFVQELAALLPGGGVAARTALTLAALHPQVQGACAAPWQAGNRLKAVQAARDAVLVRLCQLSGAGRSSDELSLVERVLDANVVLVGEPGGPEQEAVRALARGLVESVRSVPTVLAAAPERFGVDRAYELLALASLVLHRLEFAVRRPEEEAAPPAPTVTLPSPAPPAPARADPSLTVLGPVGAAKLG